MGTPQYPWSQIKIGDEFFIAAKFGEDLDSFVEHMQGKADGFCSDPINADAYRFEVRPAEGGVMVRRVDTEFTSHNAVLCRPW